MNHKQTVVFRYYVNAEMQDYNLRTNIVDKHIKEVYPQARTLMRYDERIQRYQVTTVVETFVSVVTHEILQTLAAIIGGIYQVDGVITYQVGLGSKIVVTKRLKQTRDTWYNNEDLEDAI